MQEVFGRLTVIGPAARRGYSRYVLCRCECGRTKEVYYQNLKHSRIRSCGCLKQEVQTATHATHCHTIGGKQSPEFMTWCHIRARCNNHRNKDYHRYGGRGIRVCDEWEASFETFLRDMGPRPSPKHSIDRKENNGNYEPSNCRWATAAEQSRNTSQNRMFDFRGQRLCLSDIATMTGVNAVTLHRRLKTMSIEEAVAKKKWSKRKPISSQ